MLTLNFFFFFSIPIPDGHMNIFQNRGSEAAHEEIGNKRQGILETQKVVEVRGKEVRKERNIRKK